MKVNFLSQKVFILARKHYKRPSTTIYECGIHKDDLVFQIDIPLKNLITRTAKSFLIALKLAQFEFFKTKWCETHFTFDDIFDKLDESRVSKIIEMVNSATFGQLFITDTHSDRTETLLL
jgi:DNA replication and repair protein RecF